LDPEQWGPRVAEEISTKVSNTKGAWPKLPQCPQNNEADRKIAIHLYSLWLQTVFHDATETEPLTLPMSDAEAEPIKAFEPLGRKYFEWLEHFKLRYPELAQLVRRFSSYSYWYSLSVDSAAGETGSDESLGSMMLFSSRRLDPHFLVNVRQWTENIYMLLREVESTKLAHGKGIAETISNYSHELSSVVSSLQNRLIPANFLFESDPPTPRNLYCWDDPPAFGKPPEHFDVANGRVVFEGAVADSLLLYAGIWLDRSLRFHEKGTTPLGDAIQSITKRFTSVMAAYLMRSRSSTNLRSVRDNLRTHKLFADRILGWIKYNPTHEPSLLANEQVWWYSDSEDYSGYERALIRAYCATLLNIMKNSGKEAIHNPEHIFSIIITHQTQKDGFTILLKNTLTPPQSPNEIRLNTKKGTPFVVSSIIAAYGGRLTQWGPSDDGLFWNLGFSMPWSKNIAITTINNYA
jgi:hypothetical protein